MFLGMEFEFIPTVPPLRLLFQTACASVPSIAPGQVRLCELDHADHLRDWMAQVAASRAAKDKCASFRRDHAAKAGLIVKMLALSKLIADSLLRSRA